MRNLDLTTLRSFAAVAENGGVTSAARMLNLTQSAVSMQIKRLEDLLGLTLLERAGRGVALTAAGEQLLSYARRMIALNDEVYALLTHDALEGEITLGVPEDILYPVVPRAMKAFAASFPRMRVQLLTFSTFNLKKKYADGEIDIILTTEKEPGPGGKIINTQPLVWTGAEDGIAWTRRPLPISFCKSCSFRPFAIAALDEAGISWVDIAASNDDLASDAMTSADLGIRAEMECVIHAGRQIINHGGQLPQLPAFSIVLYAGEQGGNELNQTLVEYLERAYI